MLLLYCFEILFECVDLLSMPTSSIFCVFFVSGCEFEYALPRKFRHQTSMFYDVLDKIAQQNEQRNENRERTLTFY